MLKGIESEEEGIRGIKRERKGDTDEEKSSETPEEKSNEGTPEEKSSGPEEEEDSESEEDEDSGSEGGWRESAADEEEEEEGEDTCVYNEYEDRSGEPPELDIASEDERDEDIRAYVLHVEERDSPYRDVWWRRAKGCAEFAVKHYNKRRAYRDGQLEFVELTNATSFGWCFFNITFEADNLVNGEKKIFNQMQSQKI